MARLTAPLLSLGASGSIAKALVYASWKGIPYARVHVVPTNPKSVAQQEVRGIFSTLNAMWTRMPQLARDPWQNDVKGLPLTARNRHIQANVKILIDETTLDLLVMSVAQGQAIPPINESFTPGVGLITCLAETDVPPVGYTLTSMTAAICKDGDPSPVLTVATLAEEVLVAPYSVEFDTLDTVPYQCAMWCKWTRTSDSKIHYSTAVRGQATPT
ncbi:hypothetical protein ES703_23050 [subsurface metagenome]